MAQIKIVLDVANTQALQSAEEVNQKLVELQVNGASVSVGNPQQISATSDATKKLDKEVNKTAQDAQKAGQQATNAVNQTNNALQEAEKSARGFKGGLTAASKEAARGAKDIIHSFINPITIALVAFEAATKVFSYFWNNLTENVDKLTARSEGAIKNSQRQIKVAEDRAKATTDLIKKLEQLNKVQNISVEQQRLGQSLLNRINSQYKGLGITLDQTTGKYQNLYEAQLKVNEQLRQEQSRGIRSQINAQRGIIDSELKKAFGSGIAVGGPINGNDLFTFAEKMGGTLGAQNADFLAKKWGNGTDFKAMRDVVYQIQQGLGQGQNVTLLQNVIDAFDAAIDYTEQLKQLNSVNTQITESENRLTEAFKAQKDALKATREQTQKLNKSLEDQARANSLAELDPEDRANALRGEVEQLRKKNEQLQKAQQLQDEQARYSNLNANSDRRAFDSINNERRELEKQIQDLEQKRAENNAKRSHRLQSRGDALIAGNSYISKSDFQSGFDNPWELQRRIEGAIQSYKNLDIADEYKPKADIEDLQQMLKYVRKYNDLYDQNTLIQAKLVKAQKQLNTLNEQAKQAQIDLSNSQSTRLQNQQQLADLEKERAENALAIQSKEQQIAQIEAELAEKRAEAELKAWQLEQQRIKSYSDFVNNLMNKQVEGLNDILGKKKQNLLLELQLNAEKTRGRKLTEQELEALKSYVDVMTMQDQLKANQKLNFQTNGVISNDLARKGGWASSVVVDRSTDINQQILNVQQSQVELMTKLNETMKTSNDLLKQFSVIQ